MSTNPTKLLSYSAIWRIQGDPQDSDNVLSQFVEALGEFEDKYQIKFEAAKIHTSQASSDLYIKADELGIDLSEDPRRSHENTIWFYSSQLTHQNLREA